jgi:hypothetical protein
MGAEFQLFQQQPAPSIAEMIVPPNSLISLHNTASEFCGEGEELMGEFQEDIGFVPDMPFVCTNINYAMPRRRSFKDSVSVETLMYPKVSKAPSFCLKHFQTYDQFQWEVFGLADAISLSVRPCVCLSV